MLQTRMYSKHEYTHMINLNKNSIFITKFKHAIDFQYEKKKLTNI